MVLAIFCLTATYRYLETMFFLYKIVVRSLFQSLILISTNQQVRKTTFCNIFYRSLSPKIAVLGLENWMGDRLGFLILSFLNIFKKLLNIKNSLDYQLKSQINRKKYICNGKKIQATPGFEPRTFRVVKESSTIEPRSHLQE